MCKGFYIKSEFEDVLKSGYYNSNLDYGNVYWFVYEVMKRENKMTYYFENTKKDTIMTTEDEEDYKIDKICRFCEKNF